MHRINTRPHMSLVTVVAIALMFAKIPSARAIDLNDALDIGMAVGVDMLAQKKHASPSHKNKNASAKKPATKKSPKTVPVKTPKEIPETRFVPQEILFILRPNAPETVLPALVQSLRLRRISDSNIALLHRTVYRYALTDGRTVASAVATLAGNPQVEQAQPDFTYELMDANPGSGASNQYALAQLRIPEVQAQATGAKVVVALIDSLPDINHPALAGQIRNSFSAVDTPSQGPDSHGTAMAGAIVAKGQLAGVAPGVDLLAAECFSKDQAQHMNGVTFNILKCVDWAAGQSATIQNFSFAGPKDPMLSRVMGEAVALGETFIAAAGNAGPSSPPLFPAADENAIAVTAIDKNEHLYAHAVQGKHIVLAAPGVDVLVLAPGNSTGFSTGTSIAAAEVSGLAALATEMTSKLNEQQLRGLLSKSAHKLNLPAEAAGAGLADASELVQDAKKVKLSQGASQQ